jgi:hypothetical protein
MQTDLPVPDFSTLCRRAPLLQIAPDTRTASGPISLVVDSTGLRVHGGREWMRDKYGLLKARKIWRKLHIGFDLESGEIVASCLTSQQVGDTGALPDLLAEVSGPVRRFLNWPKCMAEGHRLWPEIAQRGSDRALKTGHRTGTAQPQHGDPDIRSPHRCQRTQPHDPSRSCGLCACRITNRAKGQMRPKRYSCNAVIRMHLTCSRAD